MKSAAGLAVSQAIPIGNKYSLKLWTLAKNGRDIHLLSGQILARP